MTLFGLYHIYLKVRTLLIKKSKPTIKSDIDCYKRHQLVHSCICSREGVDLWIFWEGHTSLKETLKAMQ